MFFLLPKNQNKSVILFLKNNCLAYLESKQQCTYTEAESQHYPLCCKKIKSEVILNQCLDYMLPQSPLAPTNRSATESQSNSAQHSHLGQLYCNQEQILASIKHLILIGFQFWGMNIIHRPPTLIGMQLPLANMQISHDLGRRTTECSALCSVLREMVYEVPGRPTRIAHPNHFAQAGHSNSGTI